jgi:hypothetical protein
MRVFVCTYPSSISNGIERLAMWRRIAHIAYEKSPHHGLFS